MAEEEETDFERKLKRILDIKNDVHLKEVSIEFDELELDFGG
ncbi:MAG: hypothetical protein ACTSQI_14630 [Candidatus Helarchaeota archaeon]